MLKLIEMYRDRPVLWDCRLSEYKDSNKRHDAFTEIAVAFEVDKTEIEKKIRGLLTVFAREVKKEKDSRRSGAGANEVYNSKWYCYTTLSFLKDRNTVRNARDTEVSKTKL